MKPSFAIILASAYGLSMRLLFGFFDDVMGVMSIAFLILIPFIIGAVTVAPIPPKRLTTGVAAFFLPWLTSLVILFITISFDIEGSICWVMIYPLFAILAGLGGLSAYYIKKAHAKNQSDPTKNNFGKPNIMTLSFVFFMPVFAGFVEGEKTLAPRVCYISREVIIPATPKKVWAELTHINDLKSNEEKVSFSTVLGFPKHLRTIMDTPAVGGKRVAIYEKGLYFKETVSAYQHERLMVLDIQTDPYNIPPTVMDEHILIGGKYIDILEDRYELQALPNGTSRLILSSRFYINTPFNWYTGLWANYLMADVLEKELNLISQRAGAKF